MILNLTDLSSESLQNQIYRQIREMILSGDLLAGEMLSSIRSLAREQKVSVITVQRGYEMLEREGLINSRRGKGFFVSQLHDKKKKTLSEKKLSEKLQPLLQSAIAEGMSQQEIIKVVEILIKENKNGKGIRN